MYHPYFRGKQYELITVREMAPLIKAAGFRPIIEPVREGLSGLHKALRAMADIDGRAVVVVNPHHGDLSDDGASLTKLLKEKFLELPGISAGILLKSDMDVAEAWELYEDHADHSPVMIHAGFSDAKALSGKLGKPNGTHSHVFVDGLCQELYQRQFKGAFRVLLRDGFKRKRNADYDPIEPFSDLHAVFEDKGMDGFGDFLIVGDDYTEGGGPAYAVAIHLTFIDTDKFDSMFVHHFVSDTQDTPKDPAGKFAEALAKMMKALKRPNSKILETSAVKEYRLLHKEGHFPGLGYVKKLSMNHHIETLAEYFKSET
jgi:hypothetical protein